MRMDDGTIERIRAELASACGELPVRLVVLFGSQADGRARPDSDVDVAVQLTPNGRWDHAFRVAGLVEELVRREVDVVVLNEAGATLLLNVAADGIPLFEARVGDWRRFWHAAYRMYEEAEPVRAMQNAILQRRWGVTL